MHSQVDDLDLLMASSKKCRFIFVSADSGDVPTKKVTQGKQ